MSPEDAHKDLYSVSPAAMSDEQIARRDAEVNYDSCSVSTLSKEVCELALGIERSCLNMSIASAQLAASLENMRSLVCEVLDAYRGSYSLEVNLGGIPEDLIERAEKLLGEK